MAKKLHVEIGIDGETSISRFEGRGGDLIAAAAFAVNAFTELSRKRARKMPETLSFSCRNWLQMIIPRSGQRRFEEENTMRTNLARVEPEETTRERRARLREEMQYRRALRLIVKTCCIWLGGAAYVLAVIAGYGHMMDVAAVTGAIAVGLSVYGAM